MSRALTFIGVGLIAAAFAGAKPHHSALTATPMATPNTPNALQLTGREKQPATLTIQTRALDLKSLVIADFGDVEPAN